MKRATWRTPVRPFVGRAEELESLQDALREASAGRGSLVLVTGEPGIGKTRLMHELGRLASAADLRVLTARCWEEGGAPAYWPWIQVVREAGGEFERLTPRASATAQDSVDPDSARFTLFDAVARFLHHVADEHPLLLLIDDLHAADTPSLLLLRFMGEAIAWSRILVVGSYREGERRVHESAEHFAELVRVAGRILLRGLTLDEVEMYLAAITGTKPANSMSARLHAVTGGNPFFLGEVVALCSADELLEDAGESARDPMLRLPEVDRALIRRRIDDLSQEAVSVLRVAAVIGREFNVRLLHRISRLGAGRLLDVLAEARDSGVIVEGLPGEHYSFVHELVRETLYGELPAARRLELHLRIGRVLEELSGEARDQHMSEIAHHLAAAAPLGEVAKAVDYLVRAGDRAARLLAYEEAAAHYRRALALSSEGEESSAERRCDLLLRLGDCEWRAGDTRAVSTRFEEAARLARELGNADMLARAALGHVVGLGGFLITARYEGATGIGLLEEALAALPERDSVLRVLLLARLSAELWSPHEVERRAALSRAAIEMARRLGDAEALAAALQSSHWALGGPERVGERLASAEEMLEVARKTGSSETAFRAHNARVHCLLELCDGAGIDAEVEAMTQLSERIRQPFYAWHVVCLRAIRAILDGRFADAERLSDGALAQARVRHSEIAAYVFRYGQLLTIRWAQGRFGEVRETIREHGDRFPWISHWREAFAASELADHAGARAEIERYARGDFGELARDSFWLLHLCALAEACVLVEDSRRGARLYELLLPFADRNAVSVIEQPFGPVALRLGMLARLLRLWKEADRHFAAALARCELLGARAIRARVLLEHASALAARGEPADRGRLEARLDEAAQLCDELVMPGLSERVAALRQEPLTAQAADAALFQREGEFWTISFRGDTFRLRDLKGLRYIALLLGAPGQEIHVSELVQAAEGRQARPVDRDLLEAGWSPSLPSGAGPLLDARTKEAYRSRLRDLDEDLEEARSWADNERVALIEEEIDAVTGELARAVGFGGRDRQLSSPEERGRVSVTKTVRSAIKAIDRQCPALARHLTASIKTGRLCSYGPPAEAPPRWDL
jgi:eukaryotic-like serine/threonine-protein kinase